MIALKKNGGIIFTKMTLWNQDESGGVGNQRVEKIDKILKAKEVIRPNKLG